MADNFPLARSIAALAKEHLTTTLAQDHADHPWADAEAHAAYAQRYTTASFVAFGNRVTVLTQRDEAYPATDALDYAASVLDAGDGHIQVNPDGLSATYFLAR
jgi:hypothetical protein